MDPLLCIVIYMMNKCLVLFILRFYSFMDGDWGKFRSLGYKKRTSTFYLMLNQGSIDDDQRTCCLCVISQRNSIIILDSMVESLNVLNKFKA